LRTSKAKESSTPVAPHRLGETIESIVGCKWSLSIMHVIANDIRRPGAIERAIEGLSAKVLGDCLKRLVQMGIVEKHVFPEVPPRVEYDFTVPGKEFHEALANLRSVELLLRECRTV
jgi:DNA-binding HxlR family transcriptional regulator